ncbi:MAG: TatD family deoxyribonuclease [Clostridiales bacterium]|nr:TatD family deoxyribonuclease [Clostridiales bacterium]
MIDTHCHLNDAKFDGIESEIVDNYLKSGVDKVICVGYDFLSSEKAKSLSEEFESVYYEVGIHPDDADTYDENQFEEMLKNKSEKLVAVGEIGLDYFHNKENKELQKEVFISQIKLANKYKLPIVIHCRDAYGDTLEILKKYAPFEFGAVMHCYGGSREYAYELIKLGVSMSFGGTVTFNNAKNVQEVVKDLPKETFFFETDSPYLAPVPFRGKRNEPKFVTCVAEFVANLRNENLNELIKYTDQNATKIFKF